ncbi:MAG: hypothetical protein R2715_16685 [Ilumatobacteraceae bacterium]
MLPGSFGAVKNQTDALLELLVDYLLSTRLGSTARNRDQAVETLKLQGDAKLAVTDVFRSIAGTSPSCQQALTVSRRCVGSRDSSVSARSRPSERVKEARAEWRIDRCTERIASTVVHVHGISAHQAKGCEWDRVGVCPTDEHQAARLAARA